MRAAWQTIRHCSPSATITPPPKFQLGDSIVEYGIELRPGKWELNKRLPSLKILLPAAETI